MRHFLFMPALLGITAALLAQSSVPADNEPKEGPASQPCIVTGRVITAVDGNPLKSARVILNLEDTNTSSDRLGHFVLTDMSPGNYKVSAKPMTPSAAAGQKSEPQSKKKIEIKIEKKEAEGSQ